jgi:hypothetical protein
MSFGAVSNATVKEPMQKQRVIISTDIGGTDFDDYQSMIHFLMIANRFDVEGLISSPWGPKRDRVREIRSIIDEYEKDFPVLSQKDSGYPSPDHLRSVTVQGGLDSVPGIGYGAPNKGSDLIAKAAKSADPRPLWILVWGGIDDVAQALHDHPEIKEKIRIYWIGGPNKKWSTAAYTYLMTQHPDLFLIENNSSYRGLFLPDPDDPEFDGGRFVRENIVDRGHLGRMFSKYGGGEFKMGDTPSVLYVLGKNPENPSAESPGGGSFVRAWNRSHYILDRKAEINDLVETYGILELNVSVTSKAPSGTTATLLVPKAPGSTEYDRFPGFESADNKWTFRFSPKASRVWTYKIESNWDQLNDPEGGAFTSVNAPGEFSNFASEKYPNWWTDEPASTSAIVSKDFGPQNGAKLVAKHRRAFLEDFAATAKILGEQ